MKIDQAEVGMRVYMRKDLYEGPDEYSPGGYIAYRGDVLLVKKVWPKYKSMSVHHPHITDGTTFSVYADEVAIETLLITILEQREYEKKYGKERGGLN